MRSVKFSSLAIAFIAVSFITFTACIMTGCAGNSGNKLIAEYEPYLFVIPENDLTDEQKELKSEILDLFWNNTSVNDDNDFVLNFDRKDLADRGIPTEYYRYIRKELKNTSRGFEKILKEIQEEDPAVAKELSCISLKNSFLQAKAEYLSGKMSETANNLTSLFDNGIAVCTAEDNFENLLQIIGNAAESPIIVSTYEFIGKVQDETSLREYLSVNMAAPIEITSVSVTEDGQAKISCIPAKKRSNRYYKYIADELAAVHVKPGFGIYELDCEYDAAPFVYYVFINPADSKPVLKYNIFGWGL